MRKILATLFCVSLLLPLLSSIHTSGKPLPYASPPSTVTLKFPKPTAIRKDGYVWLKLPDCRYITTLGHPALPIKVITIKMNKGYNVSAVEATVTHKDLKDRYKIMPAFKPTRPGLEGGLTNPDPETYGRRDWYPGKWLDYKTYTGMDPATLTRIKYLVIHFYPLQYVPAEEGMVSAEKAVLDITYSGSAEEAVASTIDLVIVTSSQLKAQADSLGNWKNQTGITTQVVTTEWIYTQYTGTDEPEQIRNYINETYHTLGIKFVLIFGDADQVPVRYAYIPDGFYDKEPDIDGRLVETDLYYADLQYSWNEKRDDKWGELRLGRSDKVDGVPDLYVGRLPASTADEAETLVDKIVHYSPTNEWFTRCLLMGTDPFKDVAGAEGEILKDYIETNFVWANYSRTKLYETAGNLTVENAKAEINKRYGLINFAGHGNYPLWSFEAAGTYTNTDALSQTNGYDTSAIFSMACLTSRFSDRECLGEAFLLNPNGGGIAYYGASRLTWGYTGEAVTEGFAGDMDWRFWKSLFHCLNQSTAEKPYAGVVWGMTLGEYVATHGIYTRYLTEAGIYYLDWKTVAEFGTLLGDPTIYLKGRLYEFRGNYITPWPYLYNSSQAGQVLSNLKSVHSNYVSLLANVYQDNSASSTVYTDPRQDQALVNITEKAHNIELKVAWIMFVNSKDGAWRGTINPTNVTAWFESYREAVNRYTTLANDTGVELFIIGSELENLKEYTAQWEQVIGNVTTRYTGKISYNQNWWWSPEEYGAVFNCTWFGKLDYIGVSAFFELTTEMDPTVDELVAAWRKIVANLEGLVTKFKRPILFTEIGYRSIDGANKQPWNYTIDADVDLQEQADCYEALFQVFHAKPWFRGTLFWAWSTNPTEGGNTYKGYVVRGKPAETVLSNWYAEIAAGK